MLIIGLQQSYLMILLFGGFILIMITSIVVSIRNEKKRQAAVSQYASDLGLAYTESLPAADWDVFSKFQIANRGRGRKAGNALVADSGELRMVIFDYKFTTGSGKNSTTHKQTIVLANSETLVAPDFSISPESFLHRLGDLFGFKDIDFDEDPEFSNAFLLKGQDQESIRQFFDPNRRSAFSKFPQVTVETCGNSFVFFRPRKRAKPDEYQGLMGDAFSIYQALSQSAGADV
ncbi:MAG: hypothetical protein ACE361_23380 [Aureliella sp.]